MTEPPLSEAQSDSVARHKTAIGRIALSKPIQLALMDGVLEPETELFDYGCGRGDDLRLLETMGIRGAGWDPYHRPDAPVRPAPVVNLGYVVNVIEEPEERRETLKRAWELAERTLIIGARLTAESKTLRETEEFADGCMTSRGTFQKFFEQDELKQWIDRTLEASALPAGPGIFYVFRDERERSKLAASRYRRRIAFPRLSRPIEAFERHKEVLRPLMDFVRDRGRLPREAELSNLEDLLEQVGSVKRAFRLVNRATEPEEWSRIAEERAQDLLIYIALSRFEGRPRFSHLPRALQFDIKSFFSSYRKACEKADELLFALGAEGVIDQACIRSPIGKRTPEALYIHESALDHLSPELRIFEGCARGYLGRIEEANIIKLHRRKPRISYLAYPEFETSAHPALASSLSVDLQTFRVSIRDYRDYLNPPILHRKETFLRSDHPLHPKFERLTRIEESKGLFENASRIGTRNGWEEALRQKDLCLRGHRLLRRTS